MPVSDWADLAKQTIVWEPATSRDRYGKPQYGGIKKYTFQGRRVNKVSRRPGGNNQGVDLVSESTIWILGTPNIKYEDRVYVEGDEPPYPNILSIDRYPDETGQDLYVKVSLGSAKG
jgi:hypothetical protein